MTPIRRKLKPIPTPTEAVAGGLLAATNAETLLRAADAASQAQCFGAADGLAVLAIEEAAKARTLFARLFAGRIGARLAITDVELRSLLYGPRAHVFRQFMASVHVVLRHAARLHERGQDFDHPLEPEDIAELNHLISSSRRKERGFYVDFTESGWATPASVSESDWLASKSIAAQFVAETSRQAVDARMLLP